MAETPDISKIIGVLMQNPALISEIASLVNGAEKKDESTAEEVKEAPVAAKETAEEPVIRANQPREAQGHNKARRKELLSAMKPYLSENRRGAIDSMASILDIIDVMAKRES